MVNFWQNQYFIFEVHEESGSKELFLDDFYSKGRVGIILASAFEDLAELALAKTLLFYQVVADCFHEFLPI